MRRDGVLTGYLWSRNSCGKVKVKVKGKPTNASKASGRCTLARCPSCHEQPVSKAKSKTKGRNKRALSRLLIDDEWAFRKHSSTRPINTALLPVPSRGYLHDADEYACDVHHAAAKLMSHDMGADDASDNENVKEGIIWDAHAHNSVKHAAMQAFTQDIHVQMVMLCPPVVYPGCFANPQVAIINDNASDINHGRHAIKLQAENAVALKYDGNLAALLHVTDEVIDSNDVHNVSYLSVHARDHVNNVVTTTHMSAPESVNVVVGRIPVINAGQFVDARDFVINDDDRDVNLGDRAMVPHVDYAISLKDDGSNDNHVTMLHAADDASNDGAVHDDDHAFQSLIPGLVNVDWQMTGEEEVSNNINSDEDSLCSDWCHVACSDAIDDWYLC